MPNVTNFSGEFETGRVAVGLTAVQLPDVRCKTAQLRAVSGTVVIGHSAAVTTTTGYSMTNSLVPPPIPVDNLSQIWVIAGTSLEVEFFAVR